MHVRKQLHQALSETLQVSFASFGSNVLISSLMVLNLDSSESIRICLSKIETIDNTTTKEAIVASCICFPVALDYMCVSSKLLP